MTELFDEYAVTELFDEYGPMPRAALELAWGNFKDRGPLLQDFVSLAEAHPELVSWESVGKTVSGNDIWLMRIGKNASAKILIDSLTHGDEIPGAHTVYFLADWLLQKPYENYVLKRVQVLLIPLVNFDNYAITRQNVNGVDLNRNFVRGWCGGSSTPGDWTYKGPSPASEVETQVMRRVFEIEKPKAYLNVHDWAGNPQTQGDFRYPSYGDTAYTNGCKALHSLYAQYAQQSGLTPHKQSFGGAYGGARDDCFTVAGAISALWEETNTLTAPTETVNLDLIRNVKFPHLKAFAMACAALYGQALPPRRFIFKQWQDGDVNPTKTINV